LYQGGDWESWLVTPFNRRPEKVTFEKASKKSGESLMDTDWGKAFQV
jgi:hypothetical protein